ncbi:hypothetical protein F5148DRAFT_1147901, partial [Russula earlei]
MTDALNQAKNSYVRCGWGSEAAEQGTTTSGALTSKPDERCLRLGKTVEAVQWDTMVSGRLRCVHMMKGIQDWSRWWQDVDERSKENRGERQGSEGGGDERKDKRDDMGVVGMKGGWRVMAKVTTESQCKQNGGWKAGCSASTDRREENDGNIIWDIDVDAPAFVWYETSGTGHPWMVAYSRAQKANCPLPNDRPPPRAHAHEGSAEWLANIRGIQNLMGLSFTIIQLSTLLALPLLTITSRASCAKSNYSRKNTWLQVAKGWWWNKANLKMGERIGGRVDGMAAVPSQWMGSGGNGAVSNLTFLLEPGWVLLRPKTGGLTLKPSGAKSVQIIFVHAFMWLPADGCIQMMHGLSRTFASGQGESSNDAETA